MNDSVPANGCQPDAVREALSRVLSSEGFANSRRLQRFLTYAVEKTLSSEIEQLKEYSVAIAVFDREPSFDPRMDSIVRVEARRLRQQLAVYYQNQGLQDPLVIRLPKGSYVPEFDTRSFSVETSHVEIINVPVPAPSKPSLFHKWYWLAASAALFLLVVVGFVLQHTGVIPGKRVPHHWRLDGTTLTILDSHDRFCWRKTIPPQRADGNPYQSDVVLIADIDDDGRTEVLFNARPEKVAQKDGSLLCFEQNGDFRWEFPYGGRKTFAGRSFDPSYVGHCVRLVRSGKKPLLLTVANHYLWHPSQTALVDPHTGRLIEEYWHPGSVYYLHLQDLDGDHQDEILLGAINNPGQGLGHAAIAVLKIPFSAASPPSAAALAEFPPVTGGGEMAYVMFPLPDICKVMGQLPLMVHMTVDQNRRILVELPVPEMGGLVYYLNFDLQLVEHHLSDNFAALHERYRRQHLLDHELNAAELQKLGTIHKFAAAPDGNSPQVAKLW